MITNDGGCMNYADTPTGRLEKLKIEDDEIVKAIKFKVTELEDLRQSRNVLSARIDELERTLEYFKRPVKREVATPKPDLSISALKREYPEEFKNVDKIKPTGLDWRSECD